jgi:hypothetical protein
MVTGSLPAKVTSSARGSLKLSARMARGARALSFLFLALGLAQILFKGSITFIGVNPVQLLQSTDAAPLTARRARNRNNGQNAPFMDPSPYAKSDDDEDEEKPPRIITETEDLGMTLDGDDIMGPRGKKILDKFYDEALDGEGGMPRKEKRTSGEAFMRELLLRSCYGTWDETGRPKPAWKYTGENGRPCDFDFEKSYQNLVANVKEGKNYMGKDDGEGWTWLVAGQNPGGLFLYTMKSPPYGERPLALIKQGNEDEFFEKVNWHRLFIRLHKTNMWGGKAYRFPYPIKGKDFILR